MKTITFHATQESTTSMKAALNLSGILANPMLSTKCQVQKLG